MSQNPEEVFEAAMSMPLEARARLAWQLLLSLEQEETDEESEARWLAEIEHRLERVDKGDYEAHDWRESVSWLRSRLEGSR